MSIESIAALLFDGSLDFPVTYVPASGLTISTPAIEVLTRPDKGTDGNVSGMVGQFKHFRVQCAAFTQTPLPRDTLTDDLGNGYTVRRVERSRSGTYLLICESLSRLKARG